MSFRGGRWQHRTVLADNDAGPVSCTSPTFCAASITNEVMLNDATVRYYNGSTWGPIVHYDGDYIEWLDCHTTHVCDAATTDYFFQVTSRTQAPRLYHDRPITAMSCPTASLCRTIWPNGSYSVTYRR